MFNIFKSRKKSLELGQKNILELLSNQIIGGQSVLFSIFNKSLKEDEDNIRKIELTYFALSVMGYFYLRLSNSLDKEDVFDQVSLVVLQKSLSRTDNDMSIEGTISNYKKRYEEYDNLIRLVFGEKGVDPHACTTLLIHIYEYVMGNPANNKMIEITMYSSLIGQYLVDHVEFMKQKVNE